MATVFSVENPYTAHHFCRQPRTAQHLSSARYERSEQHARQTLRCGVLKHKYKLRHHDDSALAGGSSRPEWVSSLLVRHHFVLKGFLLYVNPLSLWILISW